MGFYNIVSKKLFQSYENLQNRTNAVHGLKKLFTKVLEVVCRVSNKIQKVGSGVTGVDR